MQAGQPVRLRVAVANCGNAAATNVRLSAFGGDSDVLVASDAAPSLKAGERRSFDLRFTPPAGRSYWLVTASADGAASVQSLVEAVGVVPQIGVALRLPKAVGTDEELTAHVSVSNRTELPVHGVRASLTLPEELVFRGATQRGSLSERSDKIEWEIGAIAAGVEWTAEATLVCFAPGQLRLIAQATGTGGLQAAAESPLVCEVRKSAGGSTLAELLAGLTFEAFDDEDRETEASPVRDTRVRHLVFRAAGSRFALPIDCVREILRPLPVTPLPGVSDWLTGVANVRGDIVTVVDLARLLGFDEPGSRRGLVIVRGENGDSLGLTIDEVAGIHPLAADHVAAVSDRLLARFLAGVAADAGGVIHRLDPPALFAAAEADSAVPA